MSLQMLGVNNALKNGLSLMGQPRNAMLLMLGLVASVFASVTAQAFTAPAVGSLAYDVYNVVINQGVEGAIGFTAGVLALVFGGFRAISGQLLTGVMALIAGIILINAENIVLSLGMMI
jgi:hypothetical protein